MPSIKLALLAVAAAVVPANAGTLSWDLSGLITCTDLDKTYTNRERPVCGMGPVTHGGFSFETSLDVDGGHVYEWNADVLNDVFLSPLGMFGSIGYYPVDRLTLTIRPTSAVDYSNAFSVPVTADMRYQGQDFHEIADGLTGTLSFIPSTAISSPTTTIHNPEPRTTLLLAGIALVAVWRKALSKYHPA